MHFDEVMDLDLWDSPASIGVDTDADYGWNRDLDFFYFPDILEEHAINEKSCVQVLKHLITKADAEIFDLEDDLAILQSQLSWAEDDEHGKLYELWCVAFKEKIKLLSTSLNMLRNRDAPSSHALNKGSKIHHQPAERICDVISALIGHNLPTKSKEGNCNSFDKETDVRDETTCASACLGLSVTRTKNKLVAANFSASRGLHVPDVRLNEKHELNVLSSTSEGTERSLSPVAERHKKVLDYDPKGGSFTLQETKNLRRSESMQFQLDCEAKDELAPALKTHALQPTDVKVEIDEDETLAMLFSLQGSRIKKPQAKPRRPKKEILQERNSKKLCIDYNGDATAVSRRLRISKGGSRKTGTGRKPPEKLALLVIENSDQNSGPARDTRSSFAPSTEINDSAVISSYGNLQNDVITAQEQAAAVSVCTGNDFKKMTRGKLMAMAKARGLKKYHKLRKSLLADMVAQRLV